MRNDRRIVKWVIAGKARFLLSLMFPGRIRPWSDSLSRKGELAMATYVTLIKITEKGSKSIKDTGKRAADFKASAKKMGIEVEETLWCMGAYDGVLI
jgi:hypothetical protein